MTIQTCLQANGRKFSVVPFSVVFFDLISVSVSKAMFNPLTPMSDQDRISPYNVNTISRRKVTRMKKNIS